jgi:hypothetical protein
VEISRWWKPDGREDNVRANFDPEDLQDLIAQARAAGWYPA